MENKPEMQTWEEKYTSIFEPFFDKTLRAETITKPLKCDQPAELAHKICDFFIRQRSNDAGISTIALCVHLGISRPTLYNIKTRGPEFKEIITLAISCIEEFWVQCLGQSEGSAKFILSSMTPYTEVTKQIVETNEFTINVNKPK